MLHRVKYKNSCIATIDPENNLSLWIDHVAINSLQAPHAKSEALALISDELRTIEKKATQGGPFARSVRRALKVSCIAPNMTCKSSLSQYTVILGEIDDINKRKLFMDLVSANHFFELQPKDVKNQAINHFNNAFINLKVSSDEKLAIAYCLVVLGTKGTLSVVDKLFDAINAQAIKACINNQSMQELSDIKTSKLIDELIKFDFTTDFNQMIHEIRMAA